MTVQELIAMLATCRQGATVNVYTDCCGCGGPVTRVTIEGDVVVIENQRFP